MRIIRTVESASSTHGGCLVPTMGALHAGHVDLVRRAATLGRPVVVSVFVNPTQFGPREDYERYPRRLDDDAAMAAAAGAEVVFAPSVEAMYPPSHPVPVPPLPAVARTPGLEDASRPDHFAGVCQVVARLFDLLRPAHAIFGEKDYQQLLVIEALVRQEGPRWPGLSIVRHPTVRDPDGMAMSSRNAYLSADGRRRGLGLARALAAAAARSARDHHAAERAMLETLAEHDLDVEYAVVRDAETLGAGTSSDRPVRALIAARVEGVRLIDNAAL